MGSSMKALMLKQICLLALFGTLCVTVDAHKHKKAEQRVVDKHLKFEPPSTGSSTATAPINRAAKTLVVETIKEFVKFLIKDIEDRVAHAKNSSLGSSGTLHEESEVTSSNDSYTLPSSTTPVYSTDKHTNEVTSSVPQKTSTTDGYTKSTSTTTAAYSTGKPSVESSSSKKPTQDVYSTTPMPSSSAIPRPPSLVGSISGVPGINFPDYTDIPITSFACSDKVYLPGFYADLETGCQVFHVCWQNRRESFLCPLGTTFNQALLACDYWYSTNCSLAPHYYSVNAESSLSMSTMDKSQKSMVDVLLEKSELPVDSSLKSSLKPDAVLSIISKFLPVKSKVVIYPKADGKREKIVASTSVGKEEVVHEVYQEEGEQQLLKVQKSTPKPEVSKVLTSSSEDKVVNKTRQIKDELKLLQSGQKETTKPQVSVDDLGSGAVLMAEIFMKKLAEKLGVLMKKDENIGLEKSSESSSVSPSMDKLKPLDPRLEAYKLATEELISSILKLKLLFKLDQFVHEHNAVKTTYKPPLKVVEKVPQSTKKPSVLTQLNPRFIVKPVSLPVKKGDKPVTAPTKPIVNVRVSKPTEKPKIPVKHVKYVWEPNPYSGMSISPETKKALAENYYKYMKIRRLS